MRGVTPPLSTRLGWQGGAWAASKRRRGGQWAAPSAGSWLCAVLVPRSQLPASPLPATAPAPPRPAPPRPAPPRPTLGL